MNIYINNLRNWSSFHAGITIYLREEKCHSAGGRESIQYSLHCVIFQSRFTQAKISPVSACMVDASDFFFCRALIGASSNVALNGLAAIATQNHPCKSFSRTKSNQIVLYVLQRFPITAYMEIKVLCGIGSQTKMSQQELLWKGQVTNGPE